MSVCAVVDISSFDIVNIIVANPNDEVFPGTFFVEVPEGKSVGLNSLYTKAVTFLSPAEQRFYAIDGAHNAEPCSLNEAIEIVTKDIKLIAADIASSSVDESYKLSVNNYAESLISAIQFISFDDLVLYWPTGWPQVSA